MSDERDENEKSENLEKQDKKKLQISDNSTIHFIDSDSQRTYGSNDKADHLLFCLHGKAPNTCCQKVEINLHCHQPRTEGVDKRARKKLLIASGLCVSFMILEIVGGVLSNSLAIATDAAHLLTDFGSFMISLFAIWLAGRPSTQRLSFGWYRAEVLGALVSVLMIWVITAILVYMAALRMIYQDFEVDAKIMLITSVIAIFVNLVMGWQLHSHSHSHGAGKSHAHKEGENINVRAAFIHVLGDVLQSFGVFIAALCIYFKPDWQLADPICTFLFSVIVLGTTLSIMKDAVMVLMEGTPSFLEYKDILNTFMEIDGVVRVHNLRIWGLSGNKVAISAHLAIDQSADPEYILKKANIAVHAKYQFFETTLQIEQYKEDMKDCNQCNDSQSLINT